MESTYTITEHDYVRAMKLFSRVTLKMAGIYAIAIVCFFMAIIFGSPVIASGAIGGLIGGFVVIVIGRLVINPLMAKRHYNKYKAIQEPITVRLMDEGVVFSTTDGSGMIKWENIYKWRQNDSYLLIYPMPRLYHIIPKSISESGFDLSRLVETLQAKVGHET